MTNTEERFHDIRLQKEYDTHDPKGQISFVLPLLSKRSKITEIVAAHGIVFALAQSGVCAAFSRGRNCTFHSYEPSRISFKFFFSHVMYVEETIFAFSLLDAETNRRLCFLNVIAEEVIRSLFYNKYNDSLITVSVYASDNFSSLKCRSTKIEYIHRGKPDAGFALFESESLKWPGFVEFDDINGKLLTFSAQDDIYKVFDMRNYTMLYSISGKNVQDIKISAGIMLMIFNRGSGRVPLKVLSIEDGTVLKSFHHLLHQNKKVDFIEMFNHKLLVKQENEDLQILDVRNFQLTEVSKTAFLTPSAFIFLYENNLFMTFRNRTVGVWNFSGELVTSFEDHLLWHPDTNTNNIYITNDQDLIISYCMADSNDSFPEGNGSINISNIMTGKSVAKIKASNSLPEENECSCNDDCSDDICNAKKLIHASRIGSTVAEALKDITALFYDEEHNEIYTGNKHGLVHVWSNCGNLGRHYHSFL